MPWDRRRSICAKLQGMRAVLQGSRARQGLTLLAAARQLVAHMETLGVTPNDRTLCARLRTKHLGLSGPFLGSSTTAPDLAPGGTFVRAEPLVLTMAAMTRLHECDSSAGCERRRRADLLDEARTTGGPPPSLAAYQIALGATRLKRRHGEVADRPWEISAILASSSSSQHGKGGAMGASEVEDAPLQATAGDLVRARRAEALLTMCVEDGVGVDAPFATRSLPCSPTQV